MKTPLRITFVITTFIAVLILGIGQTQFQAEPSTRPVTSISAESVGLANTGVTSETIQDFDISIPAIGLEHDVMPDVDPRYESEYLPILDEYVAHGKFTRLPSTADGRVYLFAHSLNTLPGITPEGGYFSHIHRLDKGDDIVLRVDGTQYNYQVRESIIVEPTQVEVYTGQSDRAEVALQACYPPGTTDKRIIVFGDLKEVR